MRRRQSLGFHDMLLPGLHILISHVPAGAGFFSLLLQRLVWCWLFELVGRVLVTEKVFGGDGADGVVRAPSINPSLF